MLVKSRGTCNMTDRKEKVVGRKEGRKERMSHKNSEALRQIFVAGPDPPSLTPTRATRAIIEMPI